MFGYTLDEVAGQELSSFALPPVGHRSDTRSTVRSAGGLREILTSRRIHKDGTDVWIEATFSAITDPNGTLVETVAIVTDITEQKRRVSDDRRHAEAINHSKAVVELAVDGTIIAANQIFLDTMGYRSAEIIGQHHRIFVKPEEAESAGYTEFWTKLREGRLQSAEFVRIAKNGRRVWLQGSYSPVFDDAGHPVKIVKYAVDVTAERLRRAEYEWQVAAIRKSHAVIAFDMHGVILDANQNFLDAMGYALEDIVGHHHRMFVEPSYAHSVDYGHFWRELKKGAHRGGVYKRLGRDGREVWLRATYNPVFDMDGLPIKVVKYATVVTDVRLQQAEYEAQIAAIHRSQCVVSFALDGTILDANDNFLSLSGYRYAEILGRHHSIFVEPVEAASHTYREFWRSFSTGEYRSGQFKRVGKDGREVWLQASYNPVFDLNGRPFKVVKYATDISTEKLRQADHAGQIEAINKAQGVMTLALDGTILDVNENALAFIGYDRAEALGRHHSMLVEPDHARSAEYRDLWAALRAGSFQQGMYKRIGKDGRKIWIQASYNPILDLNGRPCKIVAFAADVTANVEIAAAYEDAKRKADHDAATSLPNRMRLLSFMTSALPHSNARLAVFYIDLDDFRTLNGRLGTSTGDRVLGEIADRFRRILRDDQMVARIGGDEFVIAGPDLSEDEIEETCRRIVDTVSHPIHHEDGALRITASVGVAVAPDDASTPDELLRRADDTLRGAQRNGPGTYGFFATGMNKRAADRRKMTEDMRHAIAAGEFFLEYQPRFDTSTKTMRSAEALVRWSHPERGRIAPADFIPLAESSGLIVPLGSWVLQTACRMAALLPQIGISVNVSPVQFWNVDLVATVESALRNSGLAARKLELEITEGVLLEDASRARDVLDRLKALGVKLAMDDFGTGYSSMSYLCDYPFDVIKIDRKFVSNIDGTGSGRAVVQAIVGLGRALGLGITAEGVETASQLATLADDGCDEVQGYLLSRPVSSEKLIQLIAKRPPPIDLRPGLAA